MTAEAERLLALSGPELLPEWLEQLPPAVLDRAIRHRARRRRTNPEAIDTNVAVSNLRRPRSTLGVNARRVDEVYVVGPPNSGVGINIVLMD